MDMNKGYDFIYSCSACNYTERLTKWSLTLNHKCKRCEHHATELIGIINSEGQSLMFTHMTTEERQHVLNEHDKLMNVLGKANKIANKQSMRDRVYRLEEQIATLTEDVESQQERVKTLNDTNSKSEMLFLTLLETKPQAIKTLETLAETIETTEKELVTRYTSFARKKTKMIKLLVERNKLLLELNDEEK
jgi:hypothetical protein